jgi:hypothetical protein
VFGGGIPRKSQGSRWFSGLSPEIEPAPSHKPFIQPYFFRRLPDRAMPGFRKKMEK